MRRLVTSRSVTSHRCPQTLVREWHRLMGVDLAS